MLTIGRCKFGFFLVLYECISLLQVNKCLFLTVNKIREKMYWEYVIISMFLKESLQESLNPALVMILTIFFFKIKNLLTMEDLPQKIMP
jgi:hypothetical protein